ncbi:uncharacterized protein MJAP1_003783 [Malassezia japonica]|uniref:Uncharacterized protein n=1 Tax=Malassezia japonica TaxID=223818 RepID=A0AAF0F586_9BASI|nr:uncharacterized protein MJAP1_003783 [Malassezia japonica]WFD40794.1 hypothetical protein MJAP1_003783 [Malassezia japonica]
MAAPLEERSNDVKCKVAYEGELELWMNKPDKSIGPVVSNKPIKPYGKSMLLFDEESKDFPGVKFVECNVKGKDNNGDSDATFGRLELVKDKGMCIEHLPTDDAKLVALGVQKCDYENLKHKSDKQAFRSIWDGKSDVSGLNVLEKDGKTLHSQWRYKKEGNKKVLALTSDKVHFSHYNNLRVKNIKKN